ncbi:Nitrogen assimilation transcription factor nit-4, partial [Tolypocladium capitatum]
SGAAPTPDPGSVHSPAAHRRSLSSLPGGTPPGSICSMTEPTERARSDSHPVPQSVRPHRPRMAGSNSGPYRQPGQPGQPCQPVAMKPSSGPSLPLVAAATAATAATAAATTPGAKKKARRGAESPSQKRRCISTACVACRKRKSKCDGALPSCAACASVYGTECIYDPNSDHRRKGVYREKVDSIKARGSTLQIIVEAILNAPEDDVLTIVRKIRACDSLDSVAQQIVNSPSDSGVATPDQMDEDYATGLMTIQGEKELARKMGELRLENGSVRFIGGTSHLIYHGDPAVELDVESQLEQYPPSDNPMTSWTRVTTDVGLVTHLINMYFNYHYAYFAALSKKLFWRDFLRGRAGLERGTTAHCSPLLVNAILALGCHFTDVPGAYGTLGDGRTKGDHFFAEAKRLILANDEFATTRLVTVQALALMSVREAGCAREAKGWVYSGMSFRMAQDLGLNLEVSGTAKQCMTDEEVDARKVTFWGCFIYDKCWSNYLGRLPQLPRSSSNVSTLDVFPDEDAAAWYPLTDKGYDESYGQPWRTRAATLQLSSLSEISSDLLLFFYHPNHIGRSCGKSVELKKLSEIHQRLEEWRRQLPDEFEPRDGQLPNVILMHMFFHLQYIHLFRPFLKYAPSASPLSAHISPRRICTANAGAISKLMRLYKKTYNLRQICNIAVYMTHSACTIHLLNLPEKSARRDIVHGVKHLEEIAEDWPCARRTLSILSVLGRKWGCELPEDAAVVLQRTDEKYGFFSTSDIPSPGSSPHAPPMTSDDGSLSTSHGEHSPPGHCAQAHVNPVVQPASSIDDRMSMMAPLQMMGGGSCLPQQQQQHQQGIAFDTGGIEFSPDVPGGWAGQGASASTSGFGSPFLAVGGDGINVMALPDGNCQSSTGQMSRGGEGINTNGQQWILNDSARWHQNFEGWGVGGSLPADAVFVFGHNRNNIHQAPLDASEQALTNFEGLAASLSGGGWLQGLD